MRSLPDCLLMLTVTKEDYLRAAYVLEEKKSSATSTELAEYLSVSKNTVSQMLNQLAADKLVSFKKYSRSIELTKKGRGIATRLTYRHRLIEKFLVDMLDRKPEKVHEEANRLEHAFSDESIEKIRQLLGEPSLDPHGRIIPKIA